MKNELDISNHATKTDLQVPTDINIFTLSSKTELASLKTKVDYLDVEKLKNVSAELSKLSNLVDIIIH